jgi:uncharacterized protein YycO
MRAGDVLLFHRKKFQLMTWLIQLVTRSKWNHAAIALDDEQYIEATSAGVRITSSPELLVDDEVLIVPFPYLDEDDRTDAVAWAAGRVGTRYGYFNAFFNGLRSVFPGLVQVKIGSTVICSELVAEALERSGFSCGKDSALVSPADLAEAVGVARR